VDEQSTYRSLIVFRNAPFISLASWRAGVAVRAATQGMNCDRNVKVINPLNGISSGKRPPLEPGRSEQIFDNADPYDFSDRDYNYAPS
jgi:hypothetical protein